MLRTRMLFVGISGQTATILMLVGISLTGCRGKEAPPPPPVPEVATVEVQPQRIVLTKELPGRTSAYLVAQIRPQATGIIQKRLFTEGAVVEANDVLYQIDPKTYAAAYANAEAALAASKANHQTALASRDVANASLAAAKAALSRAEAAAVPIRLREERFKELLTSKAVSEQDYDEVAAALKQADAGIESAVAAVQSAEADIVRSQAGIQAALAAIQTAEAALETARIGLDYTQIRAPIGGRIGRSNVTTGALVTANQPLDLATVQQLDPIYVDVPQATADLLRLQQRLSDGRLTNGAKQAITGLILEDGSRYSHAGELKFREVSVEPMTGSFVLRMVFPNPDGVLLPGMFVRAIVEEGVNEKAILVPQESVARNTKGEPYVLIVAEDGKVQQRKIVIDRAVGNKWLIASGLDPGDQVIAEGLQKVRPGAVVRTVKHNSGPQARGAEAPAAAK
jgi:membrane fusion protein (multidrug efflux system)